MIRNGLRMRPRDSKPNLGSSARPAIDAELVRTLAQLISDSDLAELEIEKGDLRIKLVRRTDAQPQVHIEPALATAQAGVAAPVPSSARFAAVVPPEPTALEDLPGAIKSPMVGTVYRRPTPESKAFVDIGTVVKAGDKILLVEAMKTFNDIVAPRSGTVNMIFVEDGQPVEYGQPLLVIE